MARIDRFIKPLHQLGAERLIMAAGEKVRLAAGGAMRPLTTEAATLEQIEGFVSEITPAGAAGGTFEYASPTGTVTVQVTRDGGGLVVEIAPAASRAVADTTPTPTAVSPGVAPSGGLEALLKRLVESKASDLHISTGNPPLIRKDGEIVPLDGCGPLTAEQAHELLMGITPPRFRELYESTHDADFAHEIPGLARFRCNLFRDRLGPGGVFRVIASRIPTAAELGIPAHVLELCNLPKGLVLVTGPTGSGKSTTLAAMIDHINTTRSVHIITIEDPVEFVHPNRRCLINQREVGTHTAAFKVALRAALREDPDIVLVGEMRDLETVAIAIETAETGHLVFGTLHTSTAASTVDRVIDQFPTDRQAQVRVMLSESLKGVLSQTLLRKIGGGRVAALEILMVNNAVSNLIREGKTFQIPSIMQAGKGAGMVCLNDAIVDLVKRKLVEPSEALAKTVQRTELAAALARAGFDTAKGSAAAAGA